MRIRITLLVALLLSLGSTSAFAATFTSLGEGTATGVTADGLVVAYHDSTNAYVWSAANGVKNIGTGNTAGISMKGSTIVVGGNVTGVGASRWYGSSNGTGNWTTLPAAPTGSTFVATCTAAGASEVFVGGYSVDGYSRKRSCAWKETTNSTVNIIPPSSTSYNCYINGISDGGIYAGQAQYGGSSPAGSGQAVGGSPLVLFKNLVGAPSTGTEASAQAISHDGARIAGWSKTSTGIRQACYWNGPYSTGLVPTAIPSLSSHNYALARACSGDGSTIAGWSQVLGNDASTTSWIWDATNGTRDLRSVLAGAGIDMAGWQLKDVTGVSGDGKIITGNGTFSGVNSAWVVSVPEPSSFAILAFGLIPLLKFRRKS